MGCPSQVNIGDNLVFSICTHDPDTGVLTDADSAPSYRVYEGETSAAILTGTMAKLDDANTTGFYTESIACTAANGFENGKSYTIYIQATVDSDTGGISYGFKAGRVHADATAISGSTDAADKLEASVETVVIGTVNTGNTAATQTTFVSDDITEATADHYNGRIVIWTSGNLAGLATDITDYELDGNGEGAFTVTAMVEAPANDDTFVIV